MNRILAAFGITLAAMVFAGTMVAVAHGEQPECTGDRHYDGVACCPYVEPTTTTTTTLPEVEPRACPDPPPVPPCPAVTCQDGATVFVDRCPNVVFPKYVKCWTDKKGRERCPITAHPRRFSKPLGQKALACGDVNQDGTVDIGDALLIGQCSAGIRSCDFTCPVN